MSASQRRWGRTAALEALFGNALAFDQREARFAVARGRATAVKRLDAGNSGRPSGGSAEPHQAEAEQAGAQQRQDRGLRNRNPLIPGQEEGVF